MKPLSYFEARVEKDEAAGCWNWKLNLDHNGYGEFRDSGRTRKAHRGAWESLNGPIASGFFVCHRCDNKLCCNPSHLFLGTHLDNMRDMVAKGRVARGSRQGSSKLTEHDVGIIKMLLGLGVRQVRLAALYGVTKTTICDIKHGRWWCHVSPLLSLEPSS